MSGLGHRLNTVTRDLAKRWEETRADWDDAKAAEFQRRFLDDLFSSVDGAVEVIEQVDKLITKIKTDCE